LFAVCVVRTWPSGQVVVRSPFPHDQGNGVSLLFRAVFAPFL
jgi:hypothetical protein